MSGSWVYLQLGCVAGTAIEADIVIAVPIMLEFDDRASIELIKLGFEDAVRHMALQTRLD